MLLAPRVRSSVAALAAAAAQGAIGSGEDAAPPLPFMRRA